MKIIHWCKNNKEKSVLLCGIIIFFIIFLSVSIWKYNNFYYDNLDLAIFSQSLFNASEGRGVENSIQGQNYFGDHFAPLLVLLVPIYKIFAYPLTLVIVQLFGICAASYVFFLLAEKILTSKRSALLFSLLFLGNFSVHTMLLFEFHVLPFLMLGVFSLMYFYIEHKFWGYAIVVILCLLLREDVSFIVFAWSIIPLLDKRSIKWWLLPMLLGTCYFVGAMFVVNIFNTGGGYKFLTYYGWLGSTIPEIMTTLITRPLYVMRSIITLSSFELVLGLLLPTFFLPLLRVKYLLPITLVLLAQLLQKSGVEQLTLQTHYAAFYIPFLYIAAVYGYKKAREWKLYGQVVAPVLVVACIVTAFALGPLYSLAFTRIDSDHSTSSVWEFIQKIDSNDSIIASTNILPAVVNREKLYSAHYVFNGKKQFSEQEYEVSDQIDYIILNINEFRFLHYQSLFADEYKRGFIQGYERLHNIIMKNDLIPVMYSGPYIIWGKQGNEINVFNREEFVNTDHNNFIQENGIRVHGVGINYKSRFLNIQFSREQNIEEPLYISFKNGDNEIIYPLGLGLWPIMSWQENQLYEFRYNLPSEILKKDTKIEIFASQGAGYLNYLGYIDFIEMEREAILDFQLHEFYK